MPDRARGIVLAAAVLLGATLLPSHLSAEPGSPENVSGSSAVGAAARFAQAPPAKPAEPKEGEAAKKEAAEEAKRLFSLADLGLKGKLIYKNYSFFEDAARDGNFYNEGILQLEWQRKLPGGHRFTLVAEAREDTDGYVFGVNERFPDSRLHRSALGVREAVLALDFTPVRVNLGKQKYSWGTGDAFNPTDNLNPSDLLDPVDREKIAIWSANTTADVKGVNIQFVLVPIFAPSRDPHRNSRWVTPRDDQVAGGGFGGPARSAALTARSLPHTDPSTMQYGARVKSTVRGWDLSVSYYDGYEMSPVFRRLPLNQFEPVYTRIKAPGADFSTTWKKFEFHGEAVVKVEDGQGRDDRFHGILGFNYTLDELGLDWLEQIVFVVEHARETTLTSVKHRDYSEPAGLPNAFRDTLFYRALVKFDQDTEVAGAVAMDFVRLESYYAQVKLTHKLKTWLHADTGFDFFGGSDDTFWGKWHRNDRFFITLKYLF